MCVDLVRGKQPNFIQLMKHVKCTEETVLSKPLTKDQKKKIKTGSEYLWYIPREVTLSLYDCEPLQWTLRGVIKYIYG